jgi:hypothetical protein
MVRPQEALDGRGAVRFAETATQLDTMSFWGCSRGDWTDLVAQWEVTMDHELRDTLNRRADSEGQFEPTGLPQVLACRDCKALVVEANRGEHYSWHIWLNERTWDNETLASYHRAWHAEEREEEVGDEELD